MMYNIIKDNKVINTITCEPSFIDKYCALTETTYELVGEDADNAINIEQPADLTEAKLQALTDQQSFLEDCIAEMAEIVYA